MELDEKIAEFMNWGLDIPHWLLEYLDKQMQKIANHCYWFEGYKIHIRVEWITHYTDADMEKLQKRCKGKLM